MPTSTFFRLPEEKRQRLMDASWEEFTASSFSDVSINQIIRAAGIPRGSFYQYFTDKQDLFFYLLSGMQEYFSSLMSRLLKEAEGDLFLLPLWSFDRFIQASGSTDPMLVRCFRVLRMNRGLDLQQLIREKPKCMPDDIWEQTDWSAFRQKDREFVEQVFFLLIMSLASAVMEVLRAPDQWEHQRGRLKGYIEIIRSGSVAPDIVREQQGGDLC